ncbi:MAG: hypothetical protein NZ769_04295 [Anaerolineae bacterium]|nr:hypothetical protein [Anaerolineae bacterium]
MSRPEGNIGVTEITWEDLLRVLEERPEWLARVRQVVFTQDLLSLPEAVRELVEAHRRAEERLTRLETVVQELLEAHRRAEERLTRLEIAVKELREAQEQTSQQIRELREAQEQTNQQIRELREAQEQTSQQIRELREAQEQTNQQIERIWKVIEQNSIQIRELREAQEQTNQQIREIWKALEETNRRVQALESIVRDLVKTVGELTDSVRTLSRDMARMKGFYLEMQYRQKASAYFGRLLRSIRVMTPADIEDFLESRLTSEEMEDLMLLDLIVSGRLRRDPQRPEVMLALEISYIVDKEDIRRARERALLLRKAGFRAVPAVAGAEVPSELLDFARAVRVAMFEDGRVFLWDEAIEEVLDM